MNRQLSVWKLVNKSLLDHIPVMLLYVVESSGSSPGRQGFAMAVNVQGAMQGSIGGGIMEHKFVEMAKEHLANDKNEITLRKQIHDKEAAKNQSGMICSGEQTIVLYRVKEEDVNVVDQIIYCLENYSNGLLQISTSGIAFSNEVKRCKNEFVFYSENDWLYKEQIGYKNRLHIIGAGHCALAFSKIMRMMDFYIHLYDDRSGLNTFEENTDVHEKQIVGDYSELESLIHSDENSFVVVMTFGYRTDDMAVRALMKKQFRYFGLLGSKNKINKMFADYVKEGIDETFLQNIHAPVGLDIKSETPEEIAVSIAGEIIKVKNWGSQK